MVNMPKVSIGLPVYNGEKYIREALNSLLAQTFADFDLIISDNASTDNTAWICREYAAKDKRIIFHQNKKNIGGSPNYNLVFELSKKTKYFMWSAHDDVYAPEYLERCVQILDNNPAIVLCYAMTRYIDKNGDYLPRKELELKLNSPCYHCRFRDLIRMDHMMEPSAGLIRTNVLEKTPLEGPYADCDRVLLAEISLYGPFHRIPEFLFFRREHPGQSTKVFISRQERTLWFHPNGAGKIVFPHFRQLKEYLSSIRRAPLNWRQRLQCYTLMIEWLGKNRHRMKTDLEYVVKRALRPLLYLLKSRFESSA
ncbi:hypothetical protein DCC62_01635 [candidate division KSB1 bacterium]|nr:MAG: hypothetical protein DCC62_01635 [candidate division KSB1 bacterium]